MDGDGDDVNVDNMLSFVRVDGVWNGDYDDYDYLLYECDDYLIYC